MWDNCPAGWKKHDDFVMVPVALVLLAATPEQREAARRGIIDAAGKQASSNGVSFGWSA